MKIKSILIFLFFFFSFTLSMFAQVEASINPNIVVVELKSGTRVEGEVLDWKFNESITLKFSWGNTITFKQKEIKRIIQKSSLNVGKTTYNFKEKGLYYSVHTDLIAGNNGSRAHGTFGFGFSFSAGHRFNRLLNLGGGLGYDRYIWDSGENIIPVFAEISGFFQETNVSMYYNLKTGYGKAMTDDTYLLTKATGGLFVHPSFGIRWGKEDVKFTLGLGYKFQEANFSYQNPWSSTDRSEQDILFKRLNLSFGILL